MARTETEIDTDIESLVGTMAIEGLTLSADDIADCRTILRGEGSVEDMVSDLVDKYRESDNKDNREAG